MPRFAIALFLAASLQSGPPMDVIVLEGTITDRKVDFAVQALAEAATDAEVVVLQIDSSAVVAENFDELLGAVTDSSIPVVAWVGPAPARGYGLIIELLAAAHVGLAAPGVEIGYAPAFKPGRVAVPPQLAGRVTVDGPIEGVVDAIPPALSVVRVAIDGLELEVAGQPYILHTTDAALVRLHQPDLLTRLLDLASRPEAVFLFLCAGLSLAAFEFYAAGVGMTAWVAVVALVLAGYGWSVLPLRTWALGLILAGMLAYVVGFQRGRNGVLFLAGTAALVFGGLALSPGPPEFPVSPWAILLTVIGVGAFFLVGMTTVARARFSTPTIGRRHLLGRVGTAATELAPDGVVTLEGSRWPATAHRAAGIRPGDSVTVVGIRGTLLEVEPRPGNNLLDAPSGPD